MPKNKAQSSVEYLIITGFVFGTVLISAALFLYTFSNENTFNTANHQKAVGLGDDIIKKSKQIYYLGIYSKQTIVYNLPANIERMFILDLEKDKHFYYFVIYMKDKEERKLIFLSDVPIVSVVSDHVDMTDSSDLIPECKETGTKCKFYNFKEIFILSGKKSIKMETKLDGNESKVFITPKSA